MYRIILFASAALLAFAMAAAPAAADDRNTCDNETGDASIAACTRLISRNPRDAVAYRNRAVEYNRTGDYDTAIADLDEAIRLNPRYARAFGERGFAYKHKGDYSRAMADYGQAIRLEPNYGIAYYNRAECDLLQQPRLDLQQQG
jgi:tetratricopeptide (TPR) repeat protein